MQYTYHTTGPSSIHRKSHLNNGITTVKMGMPFKPIRWRREACSLMRVRSLPRMLAAYPTPKNGMGRLVQEQPARIYRPSATGQSANRPRCRD